MKTLFLIEDDRAISYALDKRNGVLVTVLRGQITVVSAPEIDRTAEEATITAERRVDLADIDGKRRPQPFPQKVTVPVKGNQFNIFYNQQGRTLGIIGATDIDVAIKEEKLPGTMVSLFPLKDRIVNIRRRGNRLDFLSIKY